MLHIEQKSHRPGAFGQRGVNRARERENSRELSGIAAALSDPLVRTMMRADRVDPAALEEALRGMARRLARRNRLGEAPPRA
ncbi:MAG: hypothetical protein IT563_07370 [Alphaproteobacteria bacterium]|nr:hypothetical protein [Alphaproteobacteria bacterium]